MRNVQHFYNTHPISEAQILDALQRERKTAGTLRPADLYAYDQDHYGGLAAVDRIAEALQLKTGQRVLDVCSGMGGPARYLATSRHAMVYGVDLTASRVLGARHLTRLVDLADQVHFVNGDATALPLTADWFDAAYSQEAFLHIPDKQGVLRELGRVLTSGGRLAFTDWTAAPGLSDADRTRLAEEMTAANLQSPNSYRSMLEDAGFADIAATDLSAQWREILLERMAMFAGMERDTVRTQGAEAHRRYMAAYEFFIDRIETGALGGHMFVARKPGRP